MNENDGQASTSSSSGQDCEKADLESREKDTSETNLTLSLPTTSSTSTPILASKSSPITPLKLLPCFYKQECEKLRKMLFLPGKRFLFCQRNRLMIVSEMFCLFNLFFRGVFHW